MSILKLARMGHPVLRTPAQPVPRQAFRDPLFQKLIDDMRETMVDSDGVGLAAPQVHESWRLAVIEVPASEAEARAEVPFLVVVNPKLTPLGEERELAWEGCLSVPDLRGLVPRHKRLRLDALDRRGKPFTVEAADFLARVIQHECDHLDGLLYLDRMEDLRTLSFIKEWDDHLAGEQAGGDD